MVKKSRHRQKVDFLTRLLVFGDVVSSSDEVDWGFKQSIPVGGVYIYTYIYDTNFSLDIKFLDIKLNQLHSFTLMTEYLVKVGSSVGIIEVAQFLYTLS